MKVKSPSKILTISGIIIFLIISWKITKTYNIEIFDFTNGIITNNDVHYKFLFIRIIIGIIAIMGILVETRNIILKRKNEIEDFVQEIIGICLNLFLITLIIVPTWTILA